MTAAEADLVAVFERLGFETGIDRGMLYIPFIPGMVWNGLVKVTETPTGTAPRDRTAGARLEPVLQELITKGTHAPHREHPMTTQKPHTAPADRPPFQGQGPLTGLRVLDIDGTLVQRGDRKAVIAATYNGSAISKTPQIDDELRDECRADLESTGAAVVIGDFLASQDFLQKELQWKGL